MKTKLSIKSTYRVNNPSYDEWKKYILKHSLWSHRLRSYDITHIIEDTEYEPFSIRFMQEFFEKILWRNTILDDYSKFYGDDINKYHSWFTTDKNKMLLLSDNNLEVKKDKNSVYHTKIKNFLKKFTNIEEVKKEVYWYLSDFKNKEVHFIFDKKIINIIMFIHNYDSMSFLKEFKGKEVMYYNLEFLIFKNIKYKPKDKYISELLGQNRVAYPTLDEVKKIAKIYS